MKRTADRLFGNDYRWSVLGAGFDQLAIAAQAAAMCGNVRVGLEDRRSQAQANSQPATPSRCAPPARSSKGSGFRSRARTRRAKSTRSRVATGSTSDSSAREDRQSCASNT